MRDSDLVETQLHGWMCRALEGDRESYEKLLEGAARIVRAYLLSKARPAGISQDGVEDLVQEVLLAIHAKKHLYRTELPLLPWIFSIARYRLIDSLRARERKPLEVEWDDEAIAGVAAEAEVDTSEVQTLLRGLPERQREIIKLAKIDELPLAEIASKFDMSLSAVKVTIHRGLKTLRERQQGGAR
jgi:RNA polymerase sigma-70 factor (ECF subfamily)